MAWKKKQTAKQKEARKYNFAIFKVRGMIAQLEKLKEDLPNRVNLHGYVDSRIHGLKILVATIKEGSHG